MPHPLGIELLTALGLGPVDHVALAAELGCRTVSIAMAQGPDMLNPHGHAPWSLRDDAALRRDLKAALRDSDVVISIAEGFGASQAGDMASRAADLDILAELGVFRIAVLDNGTERERALDQFAQLAEMTAARDMEMSIGFSPVLTLQSLPEAVEAAAQLGDGSATVLIDSMHFFRSGGTVRQIAELDPALIGHVKLGDATRKGEGDYRVETVEGRMIPGQGELPMREFVDALPRGQVLGLEVPLPSAARSGRAPQDYLGEIVKRTREFLA